MPLPLQSEQMLLDFIADKELIAKSIIDSSKTESKAGEIINNLLDSSPLDETMLAASLAESLSLETVSVTSQMVEDRPLKGKISDSFITKKMVLPYSQIDNNLHVAIADPSGLSSVNELKLLTGCQIKIFVTPISVFEKFEQTITQTTTANTADSDNKESDAPDIGGSDIIGFVDDILQEAVILGVSDIHIESFRNESRVRFRKDGALKDMDNFKEFLTMNYSAIVTRLKIMASLDIAERRLPQDGAISSELAEKTVDIRVSVLPTANGERVVMRILDPDSANFTLEELKIDEDILKKIRKAVNSPQGLVLVTGPTGSGKSTTLYSVLKEINTPEVNILTAEDPVEYDLFGVGQVQVKDSIGFSFASALRSFLRQDPEVIMVGEIRDKETGDISIKAALTGHLVLSTLHTNNAPATITRLINMGIPEYLVTSALSLVVAQRLARLNCQSCKKDDDSVLPEDLISIGFTEKEAKSIKSYRSDGCDKCMDTGVKGRRAIHEVLVITPKMREIILNGASDDEIRDTALSEGFVTMQTIGMNLVREGIISVREYRRILVLD